MQNHAPSPEYLQARAAIDTLLQGRRLLLATFHGSRLYGTATPESDIDVRIVFLPTAEEILTGTIDFSMDNNPKKLRLGKDDVDVAGFSYARFLRLLGKFDVNAVEMFFAAQSGSDALIHVDPDILSEMSTHIHHLIAVKDSSPIGHARAIAGPMAPDQGDYIQAFQDGHDMVKSALATYGGTTKLHDVPGLVARLRALL